MWTTEQYSANSFKNTQKTSHELSYSKRQHFRLEIRQRQIQQIKKEIRKKIFQPKDPNDYILLKNINLTKLLDHLKRFGVGQQTIHGLFLYASSQYSDHLFQLFDQRIIDILTQNLIQSQEEEKLKWNRKIFWILTNYTSYSQIINDLYIEKLLSIQNYLEYHLINNPKQSIPFIQETQENIVLSLSNWVIKSENCRHIMQQHKEIFYKVLKRFSSRKPAFAQAIHNSKNHPPKIYIFYCQFIHNLYSCIQYTQIDEQFQYQTLRQMRKMLSCLIEHRLMSEQEKKIVILILDAITKLFGHTLDDKPKILIEYFKYFKKIGQWFDNFLQTQLETKKSDQIAVSYLSLLQVVYGPNIPQEYQDEISKFYMKFFNQHVGKICTSMFGNKNQLFHTYTLKMLQSILMQQYMAQLIFTEYLPILSHIFFHIINSVYALRSEALICLINFLKSTIHLNSEYTNQILERLLVNKIADILAFNLWKFVDKELNLQLLVGIQILLKAEQNQYGAKLNFWRSFEEAGGVLNMEKILDESGENELKGEVSRILDSIKNHSQS